MRRTPGPAARAVRPRGTLRGSPQLRLRFGFVVIAMVLSVFGARLVQLQGVDPNVVRRDGGRRGHGQRRPARRARRHPRPQRRAARRLGRRRDGRRRPGDDRGEGARAREVPRRAGSTSTTSTTLKALRTEGQAVRVHRPPGAVQQGRGRGRRRGGGRASKGLDTRHDPVRDYPAGDVAANLVGFMGTDEPLAGFERNFDNQLAGTDGSARYEVGGGNRIPLGESTIDRRRSTARTCRPRSTSTCSGTPSGCCARPSRTRGPSPAFAIVMDTAPASCSPSPTTRRSTPATRCVADKDDLGLPGDDRRLRAGLGREGAHPQLADRRRQGHAAHQDHGAARAAPRGPRRSTTGSPTARST